MERGRGAASTFSFSVNRIATKDSNYCPLFRLLHSKSQSEAAASQLVPRTYLASRLGLPSLSNALRLISSPPPTTDLRPAPTSRDPSVCYPVCRNSFLLTGLHSIRSSFLPARCAARPSAPLSSRRSTEPPSTEALRGLPTSTTTLGRPRSLLGHLRSSLGLRCG